MKKLPTVSVILPVFNRENVLSRAIESVQSQSFSDWQLHIVDDCSQDNSAGIADDYAKKDARIHVIRLGRNQGANVARNTGIRNGSSKWIAMIDSDDEWLPDHLESLLDRAKEWEAETGIVPGAVYGWANLIPQKSKGEPRIVDDGTEGDVFADLLGAFFGWTSCMLYLREAVEKVGLFNEQLKKCDEYDLSLRVSKHYQFAAVKRPVSMIHLSSDSKNHPTGYLEIIRLYGDDMRRLLGRRSVASIRTWIAEELWKEGRRAEAARLHALCLKDCPRATLSWKRVLTFPFSR